MERSNQQNIDALSSARATAMRAGVQNPSGSNYQVAGPTIGGTATPYNSDNIEVAKGHLADSLSKASIQDTNTTTTTTTAPTAGDHTLQDTVVSGASNAAHTAAVAGKTVAAGAVAAGAATVTAVKSFFADKSTTPAVYGPTSTTTTTNSTKSHPIADFPNTEVHNIYKDSAPSPVINTHAATGPIHSVPVDVQVEPIHSTGLSGPMANPASGYRTKEADLHATSGIPAAKVDAHPTTKLNQGYNTHHSSSTTPAAELIDSRPMTDRATAPVVGATAAGGAAAAGTAAYLSNKASEAKETVKQTVHNLKTSSSSDAPKSAASSYATMDSAKGTFNPSVSSSTTSYTSPAATTPIQSTRTTDYNTNISSSTTPLSEKVKAPVVGAASAIGAAAAGTAAYLGHKASDAKGSVNNMTTPSSTAHTTSSNYGTRAPAVVETPALKSATYTTATGPTPTFTAARNEPLIQTTTTSTNPVTKAEEIRASTVTPVTEPQVVSSPRLDTYQTTTTSSSRPLANKISAPVVGAASTIGAAAAGTAAYMGSKTSEAKDSVKNSANNMTSSSNNNNTSLYSAQSNIAPTAAKTTTSSTYNNNNAAPINVVPINAASTHSQSTSANTTNELNSADRIAAAIPTAYHGSLPQVGPGEEVVWVKTVTTTDYYDDGTSTGRADVVDRHQEAIDPNSYSTVKDNQVVYNNNDQQEHHERGAGRQM